MLPITLLTGPVASGKITIAEIYATEYREHCTVIDTDLLCWVSRNSQPAPYPGDPPDSPALAQHRLGIQKACLLAKAFVVQGEEVVICDVVDDRLAAYYRELLGRLTFRIALLLPTWEEVLRRLRARGPTITEAEAALLYEQQVALTDWDWRLDNTALTAEESARWLVERWAEESGV